MTDSAISYELRGQVAFIRFNDPERLNAVTVPMAQALVAAFRQAEREARAIVLGGHGRAFCSGANLGARDMDVNDPYRDIGLQLEHIFNPLLLHIRALNIPLVTAVRGAAAGIGAGFALAGDLVVMGESAYLFEAFCKIGLVPDGANSYFLARTLGRVRAMEMLLLGERLPAAKALDWGLVNRVVADDAVDDVALELADKLAQGPSSLGLIRRMTWAALDNDFSQQLDVERWYQQQAGRSADFIEGARAFLEKRPTKFSGQ